MRAFVVVMFGLAFIAPSSADVCEPTTTEPEVTLETVAGTYYVDFIFCQPECYPNFAYWVYEESNGIEGLQKNDAYEDDTCGGRIAGDTILYASYRG